MYNIGWFSTGRDEAACQLLQTVYQALKESGLPAGISFIFSNREPGESWASDEFFALAGQLGLEVIYLSSAKFKPELRQQGKNDPRCMDTWRVEYDRQVLQLLGKRRPQPGDPAQLVVLAGYMLIVSPGLCRNLPMLNLHPAVPGGPKGTWQEVIWQLIAQKAPATGAMIHLVTENLDEGPPVTYCTFPIQGGHFQPLWEQLDRQLKEHSLAEIMRLQGESQPLFAEIRRRGVQCELPLLTDTVLELAAGKLEIRNGQVYSHGQACTGGYRLEIDSLAI